MSWRTVVITGIAKLDYKLEYLVVRKVDSTKRIHLSEIELLMIESTSVSITAALISELIKHKIKVIFCDEKHNPQSELLPYYGSHDSSGKVREQVKWDEEIRKLVWTEIITEKIRQTVNGTGNWTVTFESSVISYGSQTLTSFMSFSTLFESSVISYGSQTRKSSPKRRTWFESSVISYGSQTM